MILKIITVGLVSALVSLMLKENKKEYSMAIQLCALIIVITLVINTVSDRFESFLSYAAQLSGANEIIRVMLKAAVICILTHFVHDICRESGNSAIADAVEFGGRMLTLILALPLMEELLKTAVSFIK